nr:hypothetical protein CFP56_15095 [Quercus suber]
MDHALVEIIGRDLTGGDLRFKDTSGDVIFKVNHQSSHNNKRPFLHSNRNPLISIYGYHNGSWQGFKAGEDDQSSVYSECRARGNDIVAQTSLMYKLRQL